MLQDFFPVLVFFEKNIHHNQWKPPNRTKKTNTNISLFLGPETSISGSETSFLVSGPVKSTKFHPYLCPPQRRASGVSGLSISGHFCENEKNKVLKYISEDHCTCLGTEFAHAISKNKHFRSQIDSMLDEYLEKNSNCYHILDLIFFMNWTERLERHCEF